MGELTLQISLIRVDDRLIHGQVVVGWSKASRATRIVVADDEVAKNETQKTIMTYAAPRDVRVSILSIADAAEKLKTNGFPNDIILLLINSPISLLKLIDNGLTVKKVNIGNVRIAPGRTRLTKEVAATQEEIEAWKKIDGLGITLEAVWLPGGAITDFNKIIRSL